MVRSNFNPGHLPRISIDGTRRKISLLLPRGVVSKGVQSAVVEEYRSLENSNEIIHFYRLPLIRDSAAAELLRQVQAKICGDIVDIKTEQCFNIGVNGVLSNEKLGILKWLLQETYEPENLQSKSLLEEDPRGALTVLVEVGPRMSFTTAWSANAVSICQACNLTEVTRMERSRRYLLYLRPGSNPLEERQVNDFAAMVHDRMTECVYPSKLKSFQINAVPEAVTVVPIIERGREALEEINAKMGLAFDEQDIQYYTRLFKDDIKRNPTTVELFDIAQSNSEHSRHWFFNGKLVIDGEPMNTTLMQIVKGTLKANPNNSVIGIQG